MTPRKKDSKSAPPMVEIPVSLEAEQGVLGAVLLDPSAYDRVGDQIKEADFHSEAHRLIWRAISTLASANKPIDTLTVYEFLSNAGLMERVGGFTDIGALVSQTPSSAAVQEYAAIVREKATRRRLMETAQKILNAACSQDGRTAEDVLDEAEKSILSISETNSSKETFQRSDELVMKVIDELDDLANNPPTDGISGTPYGFVDLDKVTSGLHGGQLVILAARPAMGKTALALNIAENVALTSNLPVAVFSLEMGGTELIKRVLGSTGRIDQTRMKTANFTDDDWGRVTEASQKIVDGGTIYIDENPSLTALDIRSRVRRLAKKLDKKLGLVVIDYIQLLNASAVSKNENRATIVGEFSRSLKMLSKELDIPVLALSQLNRDLENRPNKRPNMADLRESGALEQDADMIMFIYRDEIYNPDSKDKGMAEIIIGKHRGGSLATVKMAYIGNYTRFENLAPSAYGYMD